MKVEVLYLILLLLAAILLFIDAFSGSNVRVQRGQRLGVRFLPLGLFFWVLVPLIQTLNSL